VRDRQTTLEPSKIQNQTEARQIAIAAALLVDANATGIFNMLRHFAEIRAIPPDAVMYILTQKNNIGLMINAMEQMLLREKEKEVLKDFLEGATLPHHLDNLIEFYVQILHGEKNLINADEALKTLQEDIKNEASESTIIVPEGRTKQ
jgi:hypothetical protein